MGGRIGGGSGSGVVKPTSCGMSCCDADPCPWCLWVEPLHTIAMFFVSATGRGGYVSMCRWVFIGGGSGCGWGWNWSGVQAGVA